MRVFSRTNLLLASALATGCVIVAPAAAQENTANSVDGDNGITEIVVTARKTAESVNDAPVAVTAFDSALIESRGITDISDIATQTPGISFSQAFGRSTDRPVIRGLGNVLAGVQFGVESGVSVFIDGALFRGDIQTLDFGSLERIEIVKGSQSALYGRNTYAGAINFITKTPGDVFAGRIQARVAEYDEYNISGSLDVPILPGVIAARVDGRYYEYGGQYRNSLTGNKVGQEESTNVAGTLYFTPDNNFDARFRLSYEEQNDGTPALFLQGSDQNNCQAGFRSAAFRTSSFAFPFWPVTRTSTNDNQYFCGEIQPGTVALNNEASPVPFRTSGFAPFVDTPLDGTAFDGYQTRRWYGSSVINWDIAGSGWTATAITAVRSEISRTGTDSDHSDAFVYFTINPIFSNPPGPAPNPLVEEPAFANTHRGESDDYSIDLRLATPASNPVRALAGFYKYDFQLHDREIDFSTGPDGVPFGGAGSYEETIANTSFYGRIEADLGDTITVAVEGRYLEDQKTRTEYAAGGAATLFEGDKIKDFVPRVTLDWQPSQDTLVYAIYTEGNKPGGTNASAGAGIGRPTYRSETLKGGEFGIKQTFLNSRLQVNLSAYYNDVSDVQLTTALPVGNGALTSVATNQGNAEVKGFELEVIARPVRQLTMNFGAAYTDAKFTSGCDDFEYTLNTGGLRISDAENPTATEAPLCSIAGNRIPLGSPWQLNTAADWRDSLGNGPLEYFINLNASYESSKYVQVHNLAETGDTTLVNARVGIGGDNWELALFGRNLFDEDTIPLATRWFDLRYGIGTTGIPAGTNADTSFPRAFFGALRKGRTLGAEVKFTF